MNKKQKIEALVEETAKAHDVDITKMQFTVGDNNYQVPICWEAVTFAKYLEWVNDWVMNFPDEKEVLTGDHPSSQPEYPIRMLAFQTGIPYDVLCQADINGLQLIKDTQGFWFDFETLNSKHINNVPADLVASVDIDKAPAQFMIEFVHGVNALNGRQPINLAPETIKNYFGIDILPEPLTDYYGLATFFLFASANTGLKNRNKYNLSRQTQMKMRRVLACFRALD